MPDSRLGSCLRKIPFVRLGPEQIWHHQIVPAGLATMDLHMSELNAMCLRTYFREPDRLQ